MDDLQNNKKKKTHLKPIKGCHLISELSVIKRGGRGACAVRYHDGFAGSGAEVDVVGVGGDPAVPPLDVARHVLPDALDPLAGTVGPLNAPE